MSQFSHQNGNDWAGPVSTGLLFLGSGLGALYTKYIDKWKYRWIFMLGSFGNTAFVSLIFLFLEVGFTEAITIVFVVGSLLAGLVTSIFYVGMFNYINTCSKIDNEWTKYFAINLCFVQSANLLGNTISAILIEPLGQTTYSLTMSCVIFACSLLFLTVKNYKYSDADRPSVESLP
jgi:hypothetical protein